MTDQRHTRYRRREKPSPLMRRNVVEPARLAQAQATLSLMLLAGAVALAAVLVLGLDPLRGLLTVTAALMAGAGAGFLWGRLTLAELLERFEDREIEEEEYTQEPATQPAGEDRDVPVNGNGATRHVPVQRGPREVGDVTVPGPVVAWLACNWNEGLRRNDSAAGRGVCDTSEARGANFGHAEYGQMKQAARDAKLIDAAGQWTHAGLMWLGVLASPTPQDEAE